MRGRWFLGLLLLLGLFACAPRQGQLAAPKARLLGSELLAVDPFQDRLSLRLQLELSNPNPFDLPLLESELTARLGDWSTRAMLPSLTLPKNGRTQVSLLLEGSLYGAAKTVADLLSGQELPLSLTGKLWVEALGQRMALGPYTLLQDRVRFDLALTPPEIHPLKTEVKLGFGTLTFQVRFLAKNRLPVGYRLEGALLAEVGGFPLGEAPLSLNLPPLGEEEGSLGLTVSLVSLPGIVQAVKNGTDYQLAGTLRAVIPGIWDRPLQIRLAGHLP